MAAAPEPVVSAFAASACIDAKLVLMNFLVSDKVLDKSVLHVYIMTKIFVNPGRQCKSINAKMFSMGLSARSIVTSDLQLQETY